jgi:hypothetical protein
MKRRYRPLAPALVARLTLDTDPWLSCDDCFRLVDQYVEELLQPPAGAAPDAPAMLAHLRGCPACADETTTLLLLAAEDRGLDPGPAVARLREHS